jgi:NTP pyrophosphatase (non-canonical NTP hydrolase)
MIFLKWWQINRKKINLICLSIAKMSMVIDFQAENLIRKRYEMNKQSIIEIAEFYGYDAQSRQLIEEMAELTVALNKYHRITNDMNYVYEHTKCIDSIKEEIADVYIMLEQMKYLLNIYEDDIETIINRKILRQLERINNGLE